jgi:hypothetical protein
MTAETISQANRCYSISAHPKTQNSKTGSSNKEVIILPEMANAVICTETGKSLRHQELITELRYKMKWMRSTANEINRLYNTNTIRFIPRSNIPVKYPRRTKGDKRLICSGHQGPQGGEEAHQIKYWRGSD